MEIKGYRDALERLLVHFPDRVAISSHEAAKVLGISYKTVLKYIGSASNPIPHIEADGKSFLIPITGFAKWLALAERKL